MNADWGKRRMGAVEWIWTKWALIGRSLRQAAVALYSCRLSGDDIVGQAAENAGQCDRQFSRELATRKVVVRKR